MELFRCSRLIFVQSLRELLLSRKALLFLAASLFYAAIVGVAIHLAGDREGPDELFAHITLVVVWQALMPLTAMYFAIAAIRDEIANRTLVHLISGPVPRAAIWIGKYLASSVAVILIMLVGYGAAVAAGWRASGDEFERIAVSTVRAPLIPILLGVPAYAAIGTLFALYFKRPMITGAVFVIGWEEMAGSTPGQAGVRSLTVVDSVRTLFYHAVPAATGYRRDQVFWQGAGRRDFQMPTPEDALQTLLWLTVVSLVLALLIGARRDYDSAPKD